MNLVRFYYLLRVLFNTNFVIGDFDADWTWLLMNGYIYLSGPASYGLTDTGNEFVMGRFQKILDLP